MPPASKASSNPVDVENFFVTDRSAGCDRSAAPPPIARMPTFPVEGSRLRSLKVAENRFLNGRTRSSRHPGNRDSARASPAVAMINTPAATTAHRHPHETLRMRHPLEANQSPLATDHPEERIHRFLPRRVHSTLTSQLDLEVDASSTWKVCGCVERGRTRRGLPDQRGLAGGVVEHEPAGAVLARRAGHIE